MALFAVENPRRVYSSIDSCPYSLEQLLTVSTGSDQWMTGRDADEELGEDSYYGSKTRVAL